MNSSKLFFVLWLALASIATAEVELRVSIKVILGPSNEWPDNTNTVGPASDALNINSEQVLRDNIKASNLILARHAAGYRFVLRDDTIYTLTGFANSWFTGDARTAAFRDSLEAAALADKPTWQWHDDSINIYLNDSRSGFCSRPGDNRSAITIGAGAYSTLIIHEIGHFVDLPHTHTGDNDNDNPPDDWADGDGFSETLPDDADATAAQINDRYDGTPQPFQPQEVRNDLIFNIMSYHIPQDRFVWHQRERIIETFNGSRSAVAIGRARFVQPGGNNGANGLTVANRLATIGRGVDISTTPNDAVLIRSGSYNANSEGLPLVLTKPLTLSAWRGAVTISR
jgi:hypothetical protein